MCRFDFSDRPLTTDPLTDGVRHENATLSDHFEGRGHCRDRAQWSSHRQSVGNAHPSNPVVTPCHLLRLVPTARQLELTRYGHTSGGRRLRHVEEETAVSPSAVGGGRYHLIEVVGRGGSSVVWRAYDAELQRGVAVKIMAGAAAADPNLDRRFHREARRVASMTHPNIVPVYDFGTDRGQSFIVMEYVEGQSLRQILGSSGPLPIPAVAKVAVDTLSALGQAHERGIVHRDVKPGNILVATGGEVKVVDFGVAKSLDETTDLTVLGSFIGTATYASPEQFMGGRIGPESDLYSLGCVLYHCLVGHPPFEADDVEKLILQHRFADPQPVSTVRADVPRSMSAAIMSALDKDPSKRVRGTMAMRRGFTAFVGNGFVGTGLPILSPDAVADED